MSFPRERTVVRANAKPSRSKHQAPEGHFDPDELSRRLYLVLADQQAHAERKRRARAEIAKAKEPPHSASQRRAGGKSSAEARSKPTSSSHSSSNSGRPDMAEDLRRQQLAMLNAQKKLSELALVTPSPKPTAAPESYHHVPQEAARQFTRTTTVDGMRDSRDTRNSSGSGPVHKLSKQALKTLLMGGLSNRAAEGSKKIAPFGMGKTQQEQRERDRGSERNQFKHSRTMKESSEIDVRRGSRDVDSRVRHTFQEELFRVKPDRHRNNNNHSRRYSTGDILVRAEDARHSLVLMDTLDDVLGDMSWTPPGEPDRGIVAAHEHRVDWTQSDEAPQRHRPLLSPLLRKADSIWTLRGRLGSKGSSHDKSDLSHITEESPKSPKAGFFACIANDMIYVMIPNN